MPTEAQQKAALIESITVWKAKKDYNFPSEILLGSDYCPLCCLNSEDGANDNPRTSCGECPLNEPSANGCLVTPYTKVHSAWERARERGSEARYRKLDKAIDQMVAYMEGVLKKKFPG